MVQNAVHAIIYETEPSVVTFPLCFIPSLRLPSSGLVSREGNFYRIRPPPRIGGLDNIAMRFGKLSRKIIEWRFHLRMNVKRFVEISFETFVYLS